MEAGINGEEERADEPRSDGLMALADPSLSFRKQMIKGMANRKISKVALDKLDWKAKVK